MSGPEVTAILERLARLEEKIDQLHEDHKESRGERADLEKRLRTVEVTTALNRQRVGFWGGLAGVGSLVWHLLKEALK